MENEIRERSVEVDGMTLTLLHKDGKWVFPLVTYYQHGLGTPLCLALLAYVEDSNEFESETIITVNLPGAERSAGCQFIDTNNNGEEVLDWLMLYGLCTPTGRYAVSGFCKYPEVDFYQSERFMQQDQSAQMLEDAIRRSSVWKNSSQRAQQFLAAQDKKKENPENLPEHFSENVIKAGAMFRDKFVKNGQENNVSIQNLLSDISLW